MAALLLLLGNLCSSSAQTFSSKAEKIVAAVNQRIRSVEQGYFDCHYRWKSAMKTDTSQKSGRIWFFRKSGLLDSVAQFIVTGDYQGAYDGTNYFHINGKQKTITSYPATTKGGIKKVLRSRGMDRVAFQHFLFGPEKDPFSLEKYGKAIIDTFTSGGNTFVRLTKLDSFANEMKWSSNDPDKIQVKETLELDLQGNIRKKTEWVLFTHAPQYLEQHLSPIYPLPDSAAFDRVFNLDSLLREGYNTIQEAEENTPSGPALIAVGDTFPSFALQDLNGDTVSTTDMRDGLLLLDFWYKSCAPCLMSMPSTEQIYQKYASKGLKLYGVNGTDKDRSDLLHFLQMREVSYPTLLDPGKKLSATLRVTGYPTFILAEAKTRKVLYAKSGFSPEVAEELSRLIESWKP